MPTLHSFYLEPAAWREPFALEGPEAHHASRVLRLRPGHELRLFDGQGRHGLFRILEVKKSSVSLSLLSEQTDPPPKVRCTLAAGFSKALRRGWFLEKAVELEAAALWFWQGDYSQAVLPEAQKAAWTASLVAGAKQCEASRLPELQMIHNGVQGIIERRGDFTSAFLLYEGDTGGRLLQAAELAVPGDILLVVGPEGGFSPREAKALQDADIAAVSLGDRVLRWETAAVLTLGLAWWARQAL
jgi:16S rRNA (uracil1498-N3)-methyltransferase